MSIVCRRIALQCTELKMSKCSSRHCAQRVVAKLVANGVS
jgi:hypothetical protein